MNVDTTIVLNGSAVRAAGDAPEQSDYAMLFQAMPVPSLVVDPHGIIVAANRLAKAAFQLAGYQSVSVLRLLSEHSKPDFFKALSRIPAGESTRVPLLEVRGLEEDAFRPCDVHFIVLGEKRRDSTTLALFVDRSSDAARERETKLYQSVLEHAGAAITALDPSGRALVANSAFNKLVGGGSAVGMRVAELLSPELSELSRALSSPGCGEEPSIREVTHRDSVGTHYLATDVFPMLDDRGREFAVGAVMTDITELRVTEKQLQLNAEIFARGSEGIVIADAEGCISSINPAFTDLTGRTLDEVVGCPTELLLVADLDGGQPPLEQILHSLEASDRWEGELWSTHKNGRQIPFSVRASRIQDDQGVTTNYVATLIDITARKAAESEVRRMAFHDELTGAVTRRLLLDRMEQAIRGGDRNPDGFAVMFVDVDHLKQINDTLGHEAGDDVLVEVYRRLQSVVRLSDTVARMGGDEFVLLLPGVGKEVLARRATMLSAAFAEPFQVGDRTLNLSASIGVAHYPEDGSDPRTLIRNADVAMYRVKTGGRNGWRQFNQAHDAKQQREVELSLGLRGALQGKELWPAYQPIVRLADGSLQGVEVLLRWRNEALGDPKPVEFIELAEDSGVIVPVSDWIIAEALTQVTAWSAAGMPPLRLGINIAATHFNRTDLPDMVATHLTRSGWPPEQLELEITEHAGMHRPEVSTLVVERLTRLGVRMALDDFGTGYSSLSHLRRYPIDTIKIDRQFIAGIGVDDEDETVVASVIALARALGKECGAEGVETAVQADHLRELGCHAAQGYFFGAPMSADDFAAWFDQRYRFPTSPPPANSVAAYVNRR
ncbi:MAG: EAL domain-containing protein [Candidatus Nanopelagicales bacterium]